MTRLAVFGAGRIGAVHAMNATAIPGVEVVHLVDPVADCDALAARIGARRSDAYDALSDDLDGMVICSSTDSHAELLLAAAERGLAVFCEPSGSGPCCSPVTTSEQRERSPRRSASTTS